MIALSTSLLLATANAVAVDEDTPYACRFDGADDARKASALFVNHVGYHSHRHDATRSFWPFALKATCDDMAAEAAQRGVLHGHKPMPGELFLKWSLRRERFIGIGIVVKAWDRSRTNSSPFRLRVCAGSARLVASGGYQASQVNWGMVEVMDAAPRLGDRFIDWIALDARDPSRIGRPLRHWLMPFRSTTTAWRKRRLKTG
jgi:hypothetical protein